MSNKILTDQINYYRAQAGGAGVYDYQSVLLGFEVSVEKFDENFFLMTGKRIE